MENTYLTRLIKERDELKEKIDKLEVFLKGEIYKTLEFAEQCDMKLQLDYMNRYLEILNRRLKRKSLT